MATKCIEAAVSGQKDESKEEALPRRVLLCASGGCCPTAEFNSDGSVTLTEDDQKIVIPLRSVEMLFDQLLKRGYDW